MTWPPPLPMLPFPPGRQAPLTATTLPASYDLKDAVSANRLKGLWRLATGFRLTYLGATVSLAIGLACADGHRPAAALLRGQYPGPDAATQHPACRSGLGFVVLALVEGLFTFLSGKLASQTTKGIARRLRDFVRSHPAADLQLPRSHPDRPADPTQHVGCQHAAPLLRRPGDRHRPHLPAFQHQLLRDLAAGRHPGVALRDRRPAGDHHLVLLLQAGVEGV